MDAFKILVGKQVVATTVTRHVANEVIASVSKTIEVLGKKYKKDEYTIDRDDIVIPHIYVTRFIIEE